MNGSQPPLGMNARNFLYILPYNKSHAKQNADDKLKTKRLLLQKGLNTPALLASFNSVKNVRDFDWYQLPKSFVVKPARGYGGGGIILVKKWDGISGITEDGEHISVQDLESHIFDIIMGMFSLSSLADKAFIEERIVPMKFFKKIPIYGTPDIRVIVFSGVPVMAMMRIPTIISEGKANLTQGAVGLGIDISTGITTSGWQRGKTIRLFPGTRIKLRGIKIPMWEEVLEQAVQSANASKLGFAGIDIILDKNKGPLVIEINARPGLSIQSVCRASLWERLKRVTNITPKPDIKRGIEIGKNLFTENFSQKVSKDKNANIIGIFEQVGIFNPQNGKDVQIEAKIDTGAYRTSIDQELANKLKLETTPRMIHVRSATGTAIRETAEVVLSIKNRKIPTLISVTDREHLRSDVIIGRKDLKGFLIDPQQNERIKDIKEID
ncbi:MAG: sugar-transfer associated ATP-grasp domain-containing protein [Patescibacteria group bacterium]